MTKRTKRWKLLASALALALGGCGGQQAATRPTPSSSGAPSSGASRGLPPAPGFDGSTITLGVLTPQTGSAAVIGNPLSAGNAVYIEGLNANGGVAGRYKVKLEVRDTQFQPQVAVQAYNALKGSVALFAQLFGTGITKALLPQMRADALVGSPASLDASWIREPNLLPVGAPY